MPPTPFPDTVKRAALRGFPSEDGQVAVAACDDAKLLVVAHRHLCATKLDDRLSVDLPAVDRIVRGCKRAFQDEAGAREHIEAGDAIGPCFGIDDLRGGVVFDRDAHLTIVVDADVFQDDRRAVRRDDAIADAVLNRQSDQGDPRRAVDHHDAVELWSNRQTRSLHRR